MKRTILYPLGAIVLAGLSYVGAQTLNNDPMDQLQLARCNEQSIAFITTYGMVGDLGIAKTREYLKTNCYQTTRQPTAREICLDNINHDLFFAWWWQESDWKYLTSLEQGMKSLQVSQQYKQTFCK